MVLRSAIDRLLDSPIAIPRRPSPDQQPLKTTTSFSYWSSHSPAASHFPEIIDPIINTPRHPPFPACIEGHCSFRASLVSRSRHLSTKLRFGGRLSLSLRLILRAAGFATLSAQRAISADSGSAALHSRNVTRRLFSSALSYWQCMAPD
jgi:hypothetical protein